MGYPVFKKLLYIGLFCATASQNINAATIDVVGGQLTGANNIDVNGVLYDVDFIDLSCFAIFSGCDSLSDLDFTTSSAAQSAHIALTSQIFDNPLYSTFDLSPNLVDGCTDTDQCLIWTPYALVGTTGLSAVVLFNRSNSANVAAGSGGAGINTSFGNLSGHVYADWTLVSAVPVPAAFWLFGTALVGLVGFGRRKKAT